TWCRTSGAARRGLLGRRSAGADRQVTRTGCSVLEEGERDRRGVGAGGDVLGGAEREARVRGPGALGVDLGRVEGRHEEVLLGEALATLELGVDTLAGLDEAAL